ncbi:glycosyl hydrolase family 61-domain-containing protein [Earliella scabrosa]|nr:glycosyl hydrolase family 61-domain-containing protein [Earliella scabrosa]
MRFLSTAFVAVGLSVTRVMAHGVVISFTANGKSYAGEASPYNPQNKEPSPIRFVNTTDPVTDFAANTLACGFLSTDEHHGGDFDAPVDAGSKVAAQWSKWPHVLGPMDVYMASCPGTCSDVSDPSILQWFKVYEVAGKGDGSKEWAQKDISEGKPFEFEIPADLKSGNYIARIEIIALHSVKPEFYPQCVQIAVQGSGNLVPAPEDLVSFPGAYKADDPGFNAHVFEPSFDLSEYTFPGGPKAKLVQDSGSASAPTSTSGGSESASPGVTSVPDTATVGTDAP